MIKRLLLAIVPLIFISTAVSADADHLSMEGGEGPGKGKHLVFVSGDEEYRSEEALPMMAQILAKQGFQCTVLFSLDENGIVNPDQGGSLAHSEALDTADAIIMGLRFRHWDDASMERFEKALARGVPLVALRTSTHAFNFPADSKWAKYSYNAKPETGWAKGFGRQVLGETWVNHHGAHKRQGTRSIVEAANKSHAVLNGVGTIFGTSDVYGAKPLESTVLLRGAVTETLKSDSPAIKGGKNDPMQPIAWVREYAHKDGTKNKVFTTTMGAASDLLDENLRRLVANSIFWGLEIDVPEKVDVTIPNSYKPSPFSFKAYKSGLKPADFIPGAPNFSKAGPPAAKPKGKQKKKAQPKKKPTAKKDNKKSEDNKKSALPPGVITPINPESVLFKKQPAPEKLTVQKGDHIVIIGSGLASRMNHFGHFETVMFLRFPDKELTIRNMGDEGVTPAFRSHSARNKDQQYAFPGAKELLPKEFQVDSRPAGHYETPDQWLTRLKADTIIGFFGYNSSFEGPSGLERYKKELEAFIQHTLSQKYNGDKIPQLALVSPTAMQDLSEKYNTPDGSTANINLSLYANAMRQVAAKNGAVFVDVFGVSSKWYEDGKEYTTDGAILSELGYEKLAPVLANRLFGSAKPDGSKREAVLAAVNEKNWAWLNIYKIPNGVHAYGRRYNPFGPGNYPFELKKTREMAEVRDRNILATLAGKSFDLAAEDAKTSKLPPVETNYKPSAKNGTAEYNSGDLSKTKLKVAEGYKVELFADEKQFPDLANPVQMAFDNKGRLWVSTMASYPHYKIGDALPKDKLLIFEDTDNDGKADKQITFSDDLHIPIGFEIAHDGVYVSQSGSLAFLQDTDGDDKADTKEVLLSGFDDHDTHHAISAFCADPSGAIMMAEGLFSHSNVETAYGPVRGNNGAFYRYNPKRKKLINYAQFAIPNPWGIAFDDYGQDFFLHTSGTSLSWMMPGSVKPVYGVNIKAPDLITSNKARPTSGLEFVSSRHFPDEVQGDVILNNSIGFLGAKQHKIIEDGTGFTTEYRHDLFISEDLNFRPVDLEFAPDGSLYVVDWHNALIGHMQHSARDPFRDHEHGRIYRITYPSRPLVKPAKVAGASISELLENLTLHEYRARYRTRRELRGHDQAEVLAALKPWAAKQSDDRLKLEALWVSWGAGKVDADLLNELLKSRDHRVRSAAVRVLGFNGHQIPTQAEQLKVAADDDHGRVRLEAITAGTVIAPKVGLEILSIAKAKGLDKYSEASFKHAEAALAGRTLMIAEHKKAKAPAHLKGKDAKRFVVGAEIYHREAHCGTCHQNDGKGLPDAGFPPLAGTQWAVGDPERLIKLTLKGLMGPIEVQGKTYPGHVPMTPFESLLNDDDVASVLTFVRNSFGNKASAIQPEEVGKIRAAVKDAPPMYNPSKLLEEHPMKK